MSIKLIKSIMAGFAVTLTLSGARGAAPYACVKLTPTTSCTPIETPAAYSTAWAMNCDGVIVRGLALAAPVDCSGSAFTQSLEIYVGGSGVVCKACYCRAFQPTIWKYWVPAPGVGQPDGPIMGVQQNCARYCVQTYSQIMQQYPQVLGESSIR